MYTALQLHTNSLKTLFAIMLVDCNHTIPSPSELHNTKYNTLVRAGERIALQSPPHSVPVVRAEQMFFELPGRQGGRTQLAGLLLALLLHLFHLMYLDLLLHLVFQLNLFHLLHLDLVLPGLERDRGAGGGEPGEEAGQQQLGLRGGTGGVAGWSDSIRQARHRGLVQTVQCLVSLAQVMHQKLPGPKHLCIMLNITDKTGMQRTYLSVSGTEFALPALGPPNRGAEHGVQLAGVVQGGEVLPQLRQVFSLVGGRVRTNRTPWLSKYYRLCREKRVDITSSRSAAPACSAAPFVAGNSRLAEAVGRIS